MPDYESVLSAAAQLPLAERLRLIDDLAATLPDDQPPTLSSEWLAEIQRRCGELDAGTVSAVSWEEVRQRLARQVGFDREN